MMLDKNKQDLLHRLDEIKDQLPRSERRIAHKVLENPEVVSYMRLNELAHASDVSIATVHRFCRSLGCDGFKELRQEISRSVSSAQLQAPSAANTSNEKLPNIIDKVNHSLRDLHTNTNKTALDNASKLLDDANRAIIYSSDEAFFSTMQEGASVLYKVGLPCESQLSEQAMSRTVPTLKKNDLAIFVVTDHSPEPVNWMGAIKPFGANSLSFRVGELLIPQSADVAITLERSPADQHSQLIAKFGLIILLTHLSESVSLETISAQESEQRFS